MTTKNTVTPEDIANIIEQSKIKSFIVFDKCLVVSVQLPNGFIITESSACVDPTNFNEKIGMDICMEKIRDKVWELEGYMLQNALVDRKE